jgi:hypothetical protein
MAVIANPPVRPKFRLQPSIPGLALKSPYMRIWRQRVTKPSDQLYRAGARAPRLVGGYAKRLGRNASLAS